MMDKFELISSIVCSLNNLELKGVTNWGIVINAIQWLDELKKNLKEEDERRNGNIEISEKEHNEGNSM